jgi:hypothetical protein
MGPGDEEAYWPTTLSGSVASRGGPGTEKKASETEDIHFLGERK